MGLRESDSVQVDGRVALHTGQWNRRAIIETQRCWHGVSSVSQVFLCDSRSWEDAHLDIGRHWVFFLHFVLARRRYKPAAMLYVVNEVCGKRVVHELLDFFFLIDISW
jgi:hypothetical protein